MYMHFNVIVTLFENKFQYKIYTEIDASKIR